VETIEVTAYFDIQGNITPLSFVLNGSMHHVEDTGRCWEAKGGRHMLVIDAGNRVFHLMFEFNTCTWNLVHSNPHPLENQL
jgi:Ethanolamine utilization protein EutJ (predicted chaperonin)